MPLAAQNSAKTKTANSKMSATVISSVPPASRERRANRTSCSCSKCCIAQTQLLLSKQAFPPRNQVAVPIAGILAGQKDRANYQSRKEKYQRAHGVASADSGPAHARRLKGNCEDKNDSEGEESHEAPCYETGAVASYEFRHHGSPLRQRKRIGGTLSSRCPLGA
jgi:hypothetical protein